MVGWNGFDSQEFDFVIAEMWLTPAKIYEEYGIKVNEKLLPLQKKEGQSTESAWADYTVIMVADYTEEPYQICYFNRFKANEIAIPAQYALVEEVAIQRFPNSRLVIDSSALGGRNALAFLRHLQPISYDLGSRLKAEMLATLKIALDGGQSARFRRERVRDATSGEMIDLNPYWGLIRLPNIPALLNELQNYRLDDKLIRTDCVMTLAMIIHYLEMRRPKKQNQRAIDLDFLEM